MKGPDDVDSHPEGASPFGVMDLVENVYQVNFNQLLLNFKFAVVKWHVSQFFTIFVF